MDSYQSNISRHDHGDSPAKVDGPNTLASSGVARHIPAPAPIPTKTRRSGDAILLLNIPTGFVIGCDAVSFTSRHGFRGFANVPLGPHLFWIAANDSGAVRHAFWIHVRNSLSEHDWTVHIQQWDPYHEVLSRPTDDALTDKDIREVNLIEYQAALGASAKTTVPSEGSGFAVSMPSFVTAFSQATAWTEMVSDLTPRVLNRVIGKCDGEWPITTLEGVQGEVQLDEERALLPLSYLPSTPQLSFRFSQDSNTFDREAIGRDRTTQALDSTSRILSMLVSHEDDSGGLYADTEIIGELQFAFLAGLMLGNASCSDQWWYMLTSLLFRAYALPIIRPHLALIFFRTLLAQLVYAHHCLEEGDILNTSSNPRFSQSTLRKAVAIYRKRLAEQFDDIGDDGPSAQQLHSKQAFDQLVAWLKRLGWDLDVGYVRDGMVTLEDGEQIRLRLDDDAADAEDDEGEYAPVIVEIDEEGNEAGILRWE